MKLAETEKLLSGVLYERGVDGKGFAAEMTSFARASVFQSFYAFCNTCDNIIVYILFFMSLRNFVCMRTCYFLKMKDRIIVNNTDLCTSFCASTKKTIYLCRVEQNE